MAPQALHKPSAYALPMGAELAETKRDGRRVGSQADIGPESGATNASPSQTIGARDCKLLFVMKTPKGDR